MLNKKSLKMPNWYSEATSRKTVNSMTKKKKNNKSIDVPQSNRQKPKKHTSPTETENELMFI